MALWRKCFIDSERYIKLFLNTFYSPSNVVTIERDGQVLAFLFLLSMPVKFYTREVRASYIYAVCTHPQFRRQGLMKELMEKAFKKARRRGDRFLFLVPADKWLSDVYQRMGFREDDIADVIQPDYRRYHLSGSLLHSAENIILIISHRRE